MGKHTTADETGECYNCGKKVGANNLVVNESTRWPVCLDCDCDLRMDSQESEDNCY